MMSPTPICMQESLLHTHAKLCSPTHILMSPACSTQNIVQPHPHSSVSCMHSKAVSANCAAPPTFLYLLHAVSLLHPRSPTHILMSPACTVRQSLLYLCKIVQPHPHLYAPCCPRQVLLHPSKGSAVPPPFLSPHGGVGKSCYIQARGKCSPNPHAYVYTE